jgi:hypothetical protein
MPLLHALRSTSSQVPSALGLDPTISSPQLLGFLVPTSTINVRVQLQYCLPVKEYPSSSTLGTGPFHYCLLFITFESCMVYLL